MFRGATESYDHSMSKLRQLQHARQTPMNWKEFPLLMDKLSVSNGRTPVVLLGCVTAFVSHGSLEGALSLAIVASGWGSRSKPASPCHLFATCKGPNEHVHRWDDKPTSGLSLVRLSKCSVSAHNDAPKYFQTLWSRKDVVTHRLIPCQHPHCRVPVNPGSPELDGFHLITCMYISKYFFPTKKNLWWLTSFHILRKFHTSTRGFLLLGSPWSLFKRGCHFKSCQPRRRHTIIHIYIHTYTNFLETNWLRTHAEQASRQNDINVQT